MYVLELLLSPIIWLMGEVLEIYIGVFSSAGISILILSFTFSLILLPLQRMGRRVEDRVGAKMRAVNTELQNRKGQLKGEELFLLTEEIYKDHKYHPIHSVAMGASLFVMLPVLISAILLFTSGEILVGVGFLFIDDLSKPDGLLGPVHMLPLLMTAITLLDARLRFKDDKKSQVRFLFIAVILLVLVYNLGSGLVLYWIGNNFVSLVVSRIQAR